MLLHNDYFSNRECADLTRFVLIDYNWYDSIN